MKTERAIRAGDYLAGERELYRVEEIIGERVLLEECRDCRLSEVPIGELSALRRVERTAPPVAQGPPGPAWGSDTEAG